MPELTIGGLAQAAGVGVETVRFYQHKGLVPEPQRPLGGVRRYGHAEVARIRFIRSAQELGFTLADVARLLTLEEGGACADVRHLAEQKLQVVRKRLADLGRMETALSSLVRRCRTSHGHMRCPIIATLAASTEWPFKPAPRSPAPPR